MAKRSWGALFASILAAAPVAAFACPDISGTFECPASGSQPALTLVAVTKPGIEGFATYTFTYKIMGKDISKEAVASPKGLLAKNGQINACSDAALIRKSAAGSELEQTFINAAGNFETVKDGKTEMVCIRKSK